MVSTLMRKGACVSVIGICMRKGICVSVVGILQNVTVFCRNNEYVNTRKNIPFRYNTSDKIHINYIRTNCLIFF